MSGYPGKLKDGFSGYTDRNKNAQFNLGREVFLVPIAWDFDGWPLVDNHNGMVNLTERKPNLASNRPPLQSRVDNFEEADLDLIWCMRRQQHYDFHAGLAMDFVPENGHEEAGFVILQNERFGYLLLKQLHNGQPAVCCYRLVNGKRELIRMEPLGDGRLYLFIEGGEGSYSFYYGSSERQRLALAVQDDGALLSTLVADGYIGTYLGMYASSCHQTSANYADFDWFRYEIIEEP